MFFAQGMFFYASKDGLNPKHKYIVRKRECAPPDTQNKIKMILIHKLLPCPHSEKHTSYLWARAGRGRAHSGQQYMHVGGGWGGGAH